VLLIIEIIVRNIFNRLSNIPARKAFVFALPIALLIVVFSFSLSGGAQQFSNLANAFLHGQLNFLHSIGGQGYDPVLYHGKIYWDEGPFPAIILMPFVALFSLFHVFFEQGYLQWAILLGILYVLFKLARKFNYSIEDSLVLMLGFFLGSAFIGVASDSSSWIYAQALTTALLFFSIYEYFTRRRWWLIGLLCGLLVLTRITAAPVVIFFALELWHEHKPKIQASKWLQLGLPVVIAGGLYCLYNFLRFHNPLDSGYAYQLLSPDSAESRSLGIVGLAHIPTNLYSMLLRGPVPVLRDSTSWTLRFPYLQDNNLGMSIFITSPYLLNLFTYKWSSFDSRCRHLLIAAGVSAFLVLSSFAIGSEQFGFRYSLDFLPEIFVLFMILYKKHHDHLSRGIKLLLLGSGFTNLYLLQGYLY